MLVGGMSILAGHITAEKLTKFILYSEWLIYSTWWVGDNLSSLMQSVGASEKVFQLMDLLPSDQFISKGKKIMNVSGTFYINMLFHVIFRLNNFCCCFSWCICLCLTVLACLEFV